MAWRCSCSGESGNCLTLFPGSVCLKHAKISYSGSGRPSGAVLVDKRRHGLSWGKTVDAFHLPDSSKNCGSLGSFDTPTLQRSVRRRSTFSRPWHHRNQQGARGKPRRWVVRGFADEVSICWVLTFTLLSSFEKD